MAAMMRAKMVLHSITTFGNGQVTSEQLTFSAVPRPQGYADTEGMDEDNTYAKYSPTAEVKITIANPALFGKFTPGERYYVDFTPTE